MKKVFALLMVAVMLVSLAACGTTTSSEANAPAAAPEATNEKAKIGNLCISMMSDFCVQVDNGIRRACDEKGYELITIDVNADPELELSGLETMLTSGVKAFYTISVASENVWNTVQEKDSSVAILSQQPGATANAHVREDNVGMAEMFIKSLNAHMAEQNMSSAKVAFMWLGECESPEMSMYAGRQEILEVVKKAFEGTDNEILCELYSSTSEGQSNNAESILNMYPECNVIFCYGSDMAVIAANIVTSAGRGDDSFYIFASESSEEVYNQIANPSSPLRACASGSIESLGYAIGTQLITYVETGVIADVPVPKELCDSSNVADFMQ